MFKKDSMFFILIFLMILENFCQVVPNTTNSTNPTNSTVTSIKTAVFNISQPCKNFQIPYFGFENEKPINLTTRYNLTSKLRLSNTYTFKQTILENNCYQAQLLGKNVNNTNIRFLNQTKTDIVLRLVFENIEKGQSYHIIFPVVDSNKTASVQLKSILNSIETNSNPIGSFGYFPSPNSFVAIVPKRFEYPLVNASVSAVTCPDWQALNYTFVRFNCLQEEGELYLKYTYNTVTNNFAFWVWILLMLGFIAISNFFDENVDVEPHIQDDPWLVHPFVSLHKASQVNSFPRRPRIALIFITASACFWFNAIIDYRYMNIPQKKDISLVIRLVVLGVTSAIFALIFEFLSAIFIILYYRVHDSFVKDFKHFDDPKTNKVKIETFEEKTFRYIHLFYFQNIIFGCFFLMTPIYWTYDFSGTNQAYWFLQGVIGICWKYFVFDVLLVQLARIPFIKRLLYYRGTLPHYPTLVDYLKNEKYL